MFELLFLDDEIRDMLMENKTTDDIRNAAKSKGMTLLRDMGIDYVFDGTTTAEEVIRETVLDA